MRLSLLHRNCLLISREESAMQDKIHNMILTPPSPYDMLRLASHSGGKRTYPDCFAPGEGEMTDRVGQQLGNYRLLRLLGRGGFADVYLGEHIYLKKPAALKVLHLRLDEQDTAQFLREAQTLAGLDHPHIVRVLDFAVQDGMPFLVMDYAVGGTLRTRHPAGTRIPLDQVIAYISQVASALQYAHNQRLMHRDVKPENMLLGAREQVLLADFGLAMLTPSSRSGSTQAMDPAMAGTAPYLAPEQLQGQPRPASDQYALGVVVYEWLCGQRPFRGAPIEVALQHVSAPPPPLHEQLPDLSPAVEEVVMRALAKEPERRFPSVQDFATALQHACQPTSHPLSVSIPSTRSEALCSTPKAEPMWKVPTSFRPLLGREQDVAAICALLSRPEVRLMTLLGTGGDGKTRLSLEVATQMRDAFADGVCFVPLAPVGDPARVLGAIAQALGLWEAGDLPLEEQVRAALRDRHLLLLPDNFEHLLKAAPQLAALLASCSHLSMLVTSRAALHLSGEQEFLVPPLALPDLTHLPEPQALAQLASVRLFVLRAQAFQPAFELTAANARTIADICVRLDGLPLAIELAAARIKLLPPQALLVRLSQRLAVLTSGTQDAPVRQQTLRNTLQWSYDLLSAEEQRLFRQLSVFLRGWTLEAVEAVAKMSLMIPTLPPQPEASRANQSQEKGRDGISVLDGVASLLDKSLLFQVGYEGQEEPRLIMLATVREFGLECLVAQGEMEATRHAHADYYLELAQQAEKELGGAQQAAWLEQLEQAHENLRAALDWFLERGEATSALRLCSAIWWFWSVRGHVTEGRNFLERALAGSAGVATVVRAKALNAAGMLALNQDDYDVGEAFCRESLALFRELGDKQGMALTLYRLGLLAWWKGQYPAARSLEEEALAFYRELGDKGGAADPLLILSRLALVQRNHAGARSLAEESLALFREVSDRWGIAYVLLHLARMIFAQGDSARAQPLVQECLKISRELGYKEGIAESLSLLGQIALHQGETALAHSLLAESQLLFREVGDRRGAARSLCLFANVITAQGDNARARGLYEESLALLRALGDTEYLALCLEGLGAAIAASSNVVAPLADARSAVRLWGMAEALR